MDFDASVLLGAISTLGGVVAYLWKQITSDNKKRDADLDACLARERTYLKRLADIDD